MKKITLILSLFLCSCSVNLKDSIQIPEIKINDSKIATESKLSNTYLFLDQFNDTRAEKHIIEYEGKKVLAKNEISALVMNAIQTGLTKKGFSFSDTAPVVITGEVKQFMAEVKSGVPKKIEATSAIFIEILDPANKRIYSANYQGTAFAEEGSVSEDDVRRVLATSMEETVVQMSNDQRLITLLSSY